ncbi:hypothetical protein ABPG75_010378 [Micractinium tetrahymenae]
MTAVLSCSGLYLGRRPALQALPLLRRKRGATIRRASAPLRGNLEDLDDFDHFDDPSHFTDAQLPPDQGPQSTLEAQRAAREAGTPDAVMAREQNLDFHAVSHADRAAAHQHTFPELIHGQPGELATQHGMSQEQRQLMEAHMAGREGREEGRSTPAGHQERPAVEGPGDLGAPQAASPASASPASGSKVAEPEAGRPTSAAGREGGGTADASASAQVPPTAHGMEPQQNKSPPVDAA